MISRSLLFIYLDIPQELKDPYRECFAIWKRSKFYLVVPYSGTISSLFGDENTTREVK